MKENPYVVQTGDSYNMVMQIQEKASWYLNKYIELSEEE